MNFKSNDFIKIIYNILNKDTEKVTEKDLEQIARISIKGKTFLEEDTDIQTQDLINLKTLKSCNISYMNLRESDFDNFNRLELLENIQFNNCTFDCDKISFNRSVSSLYLYNCDNFDADLVGDNSLRTISLIGDKTKDCFDKLDIKSFKSLSGLEKVEIHYFNIQNIEKLLEFAPNIKELNIDGCMVENSKYVDELKNMIKVSNNEKFLLAGI